MRQNQSALAGRHPSGYAMAMDEADAIIARLGLAPHPEGGWYRETWVADAADGERPRATAILFLLKGGERSHWHRVDAEELWLWHAGHPLTLGIAADDGTTPVLHRLGPDVLVGDSPQVRVPAGQWQSATADRGWALVSCIVSPGFRFSGFVLAPSGWAPGS